MSGKRWWIIVLIIFVIAMAFRLTLAVQDSEQTTGINNDNYYYYLEGYLITEGHFFTEPSCMAELSPGQMAPIAQSYFNNPVLGNQLKSQVNLQANQFGIRPTQLCTVTTAEYPPMTPLVYAIPISLGFKAVNDVLYFVALIGALTSVLMAIGARLAFGKGPGIIAGIITAISPCFFGFDLRTMSEPIEQFFFAMLIAAIFLYVKKHTKPRALLIGIALAFMILTRGEALVIGAVILAILFYMIGRKYELNIKEKLLHVGIILCSTLLIMSPWLFLTYKQFGVPIVSIDGGSSLADSNSQFTYYGQSTGSWNAFNSSGANIPASRRYHHDLSTFDQNQATSFILHHIGRWPVVVIDRVGREYFVSYSSNQFNFVKDFENWRPWIIYAYAISIWLTTIAALYGIILLRKDGKLQKVALLLGAALGNYAILIFIYATPRVLAASFVPMTLLASVGVGGVISRIKKKSLINKPMHSETVEV
ncbi:MAG: hypothetical protein HKL80_09890 [Acidimicrobiales bacterium]|nr:hypothetical protein [Acidimicrobiales bacterium]